MSMVGLPFQNVADARFGGRISELLTFKICRIPELRGRDSHPWGPLAGQGEQRARSEQERGRERFNGRSGNARGARSSAAATDSRPPTRRRRKRSCWRLLQLPLGRDPLPPRSPGSHWRLPRPSRCYSSRAPAPGLATPRPH